MSAPRVSVLLASRDGQRHLGAALASIAAQTWPDVELIAVDDGSRDGTPGILAGFAEQHPRTVVLTTPGVGLAGALALAAKHATGDLLARHDDDDGSLPDRLEWQVRWLQDRPDIGVVGTGAEVIDDSGRTIGTYPVPLHSGAIRRMLRRAPPFVHGSVMMRRECYERIGGYRAAFGAAQDFDLWLRVPPEFGLANLPERLYRWRRHPRGVFSRARDRQLFFAAVARAFFDERKDGHPDSVELLDAAIDPQRFLDGYAHADRAALYLGEAYVREGRPAEGRRWLGRALASPRTRARALAWWSLSLPAALTPRARRASGGVR